MANKTRVLIVDDSALMRNILTDIFSQSEKFLVVGTASNGRNALELVEKERPDVITLDVDMPIMDGYTTLKKIIEMDRGGAVIMISGLTQEGAKLTLKCLEAGAFDFVPKPIAQGQFAIKDMAQEIVAKSISAHRANLVRRLRRMTPVAPLAMTPPRKVGTSQIRLIAIGISTGGPKALMDIFPSFPEDTPPIFIVQHMPPTFTRSFAERLGQSSNLTVNEAVDGMEVGVGHAVVAPGGRHLEVAVSGGKYICKLNDSERVNQHRPSATVLFQSVARLGGDTMGVIMTGMGADGLEGLQEMKQVGATIIAQDKDSCVVYGMPKAVVTAGIADKVVPLSQIVPTIVELCKMVKKT